MFKVIHNSEESFAREAKKSELPVRIGLKSKEAEEGMVGVYVKVTAVVNGVIHETQFPLRVLPSSIALAPEERKKTFAEFKKVAQGLKEYLEKEGVREVEIGSYYEAVEGAV